jgi:hypothetical protein
MKFPPGKDHRDVGRISVVLALGRLWYGEPGAISNAVGYAKFYSRSHNAVIRIHQRRARGEFGHSMRSVAVFVGFCYQQTDNLEDSG